MSSKNVISLILLLCTMCLMLGIVDTFVNYKKNVSVTKASGKKILATSLKNDKIALISLNGIISAGSENGGLFKDSNSAVNTLRALNEALKDRSVKGVLLKINTAGGTVAMTQSIYDVILQIRNIKPIVVYMEDIATSGGYYIASASDRIVAQGGTLTGSIGVIISTMDMHKLLQNKLSIVPNIIKSGRFKDIGSSMKEMTPEDRQILQGIVNDSYDQFLNAIIKGRIDRNDKYTEKRKDLDIKTLVAFADGSVFTGLQAEKLGFIDSIGTLDKAYNMVKNMAKEKYKIKYHDLPLESYNIGNPLENILFNFSNELSENRSSNGIVSILNSVLPVSAKFSRMPLYLWE